MGNAVLYMSMSVDGFVTGPNDGPDNGLGDGGHRLHEWLKLDDVAPGHGGLLAGLTGVDHEVMREALATGAVVTGRRTFEAAGGWGGDHHDGVAIRVLSRRPPDPALTWPGVVYTDDVADAVRSAKESAGGRDVLVHGAVTAQLALAAGVLDEMVIHLVPVLLGQGRRLFDGMPAEQHELEPVSALAGEGVHHLRYAVRR